MGFTVIGGWQGEVAAMKVRICAAAAVIVGAGLALGQAYQIPLPTEKEIRAQVDAGEYRDALKGLLRVLELKGKQAEGIDRVPLLMLRAECQMQIKQTKAALDSLEEARKEALAAQRPEDVGMALAMSTLIKKSFAFKYKPRTSTGPVTGQPIDILDRKARAEAFKALFADELTSTRIRVRQAELARALPPVVEAATVAAGLRAMEKAGTNDTNQTDTLTRQLGQHAVDLLSGSQADLSAQVDALAKYASTIVTVPVVQYDSVSHKSWIQQVTRPHGLEPDKVQQLKAVQETCMKTKDAAEELAQLLPVQAEAFKSVSTGAVSLAKRAGEVATESPKY
jgi:hypothetical protein